MLLSFDADNTQDCFDNGKPVERQGRKVTGLKSLIKGSRTTGAEARDFFKYGRYHWAGNGCFSFTLISVFNIL